MVAVGDIHHSFFTAQVLNGFPAKKKWYIHGVVKTDLYGVVVDIYKGIKSRSTSQPDTTRLTRHD